MFSPPLYQVYKFKFSDIRKAKLHITGNEKELEIFKINQQDNMLFRQIRLITNDYSKKNKYIVFVDAHGSNSDKEMFKTMVIEGFYIGDRHFVLSERSPSMTRNNMLSFVDDSIFEELDKRVSMDLDVNKENKPVLAKYVGYRGLMFSSCHCLEGWLPKMIVVPDYFTTIRNQNIKYVVDSETEYTDKVTGEVKKWKQKDITSGIKDIEINAFDGSGIHHPQITREIQELLNTDCIPTSIQLRFPFGKGLSTEFDYTSFLSERGIETIKDIWGVEHSVYEPMIILTAGMYKGLGYFKKHKDVRDWNTYWEKFHKYNHCIGIAKWNFSKEQEPVYTKANYQILQDLNLEYEDFRKLAEYSMCWVEDVVDGKHIDQTFCFLGMTYDTHEPMNDYVKSILKNKEMMKEKCVRDYMVDLFSKTIDDFKCGKLYLKSCFKFLVPDLVAMCEHIGGLPVNGCLESNEFYSNNIDGDIFGERLLERNPHICRSEHTVLTGVTNPLLDKYCKHMSNVCMINIKSLTPQRLNGAD